eukprot:m.388027 g.388027  ORF g.388027 m.388027 type:complete len:520 (-) comp21042_c0_seq1:200-1759(-)
MEKYENLGTVGEGSYGMVLKCRNRESGQLVAIKRFLESEEDKQVKKIAMREVKMLKLLRHDNLVNLLEVFRRKKRLYLVFEYVDHTLLDDLEANEVYGLSSSTVRQYLWQIISAVEFCHSRNVIHRDVKPENILVSKEGIVKLCDFGFARIVASAAIGEVHTDYVATRWYRAPELLVGDITYGKSVDVWAIGCLLAEMLTAEPMFPGDSDIDQLHHIVKCLGNLTRSHTETFMHNSLFIGIRIPQVATPVTLSKKLPTVSPKAMDVLHACLQLDPDKRETCEQLLQQPFFVDDNFAEQFPSELKARIRKAERRTGHKEMKERDKKRRSQQCKKVGVAAPAGKSDGATACGGGDTGTGTTMSSPPGAHHASKSVRGTSENGDAADGEQHVSPDGGDAVGLGAARGTGGTLPQLGVTSSTAAPGRTSMGTDSTLPPLLPVSESGGGNTTATSPFRTGKTPAYGQGLKGIPSFPQMSSSGVATTNRPPLGANVTKKVGKQAHKQHHLPKGSLHQYKHPHGNG